MLGRRQTGERRHAQRSANRFEPLTPCIVWPFAGIGYTCRALGSCTGLGWHVTDMTCRAAVDMPAE